MSDVEHFVELYFSLGFTNKEILNLLAHQHHIVISIRTLKRICKKMHLFRRKNQTCVEEIAAFLESSSGEHGSAPAGAPTRYGTWIHMIN